MLDRSRPIFFRAKSSAATAPVIETETAKACYGTSHELLEPFVAECMDLPCSRRQ